MIKDFKVFQAIIYNAIDYGYMRAHKHVDNPTEQAIKDSIISALENEYFEWHTLDQ